MESYQSNYQENLTIEQNPLLVTASTAVDLKLFKVVIKKLNIAIIIQLLASIFFIGFWAFGFFVLNDIKFILLIGFFAVLVCLICFYILKVKMKKFYLKGTIHYFAFYKNYILMKSFTNNVEVSRSNLNYTDIVHKKYLAHKREAGYLILYYQSKFVPLYVDLQSTRPEQIALLQDIFKIQLLK